MTSKPTIIHVILDRSGSMVSTRDGMIQAFDDFVKEQRAVPGKTRWSLTLFDTPEHTPEVQTVYRGVKGRDVPRLGSERAPFVPRGLTPLYDAIGSTVSNIESDDDQKVAIVVITDGQENASQEWSYHKVQELLKEKTTAGWQLVFLGAGLDARSIGRSLGFASTVAYDNSAKGYTEGVKAMSLTVSSYREVGDIVSKDEDLRS